MTTLREAAQQALEAMRCAVPTGKITLYAWDKAMADLDAALAQEQPNPPGCDHCNHPLYAATRCRVCGRVTEQAEPVEPVAWRISYPNDPELGFWFAEGIGGQGCLNEPLYTAPPQRKPLTEEEIRDLWSWSMTAEAERTATTQQHAFTRAVERAHGIKE